MVQSSTKGGAFERLCGREISLWLTGGKDDTQLIRSVSSGGWARRKVRQVGDLAPNGPEGEAFRLVFGVECKNREEFKWQHLWTSEEPKLLQWWIKHAAECDDAGLMPMLIYKRNYQPGLVVYPTELDRELHGDGNGTFDVRFDLWWNELRLTFAEWDRFREAVHPDRFMAAARALL